MNLLPKCPTCGRLTVDNVQHCPKFSTSKWRRFCQLILCKCGTIYGPPPKVR